MRTMARLKFPYPDDQEVIVKFLEGKNKGKEANVLYSKGGVLYMGSRPIMHFLPDGTLQCISPNISFDSHARFHVVNFILEAIEDENRVVIEQRREPQDGMAEQAWFMGGQELTPGLPFTVAGPMTMMAWRGERGVKLS